MRTNPLKELTDEELKDYEFCLQQNFCKVTVGNRVTEDYSRWLPTYNNLILYVVAEQEVIYQSNDISGSKTFGEVAKILLEQEKQLRKQQNFSMPNSISAKKKCVSVTWCRNFCEAVPFNTFGRRRKRKNCSKINKYEKDIHKRKNNGLRLRSSR